jgi:subtilisin family serine protease
MSKRSAGRRAAAVFLPLLLLAAPSAASAAQPISPAAATTDRLIVVARSEADYDRLRETVQRSGGAIVKDVRAAGMLVMRASPAARAQVQASGLARGIARDHIEQLTPTVAAKLDLTNTSAVRTRTAVGAAASRAVAAAKGRTPKSDPAMDFPGLMWSFDRIEAPAAWQMSQGEPQVKVGVADTGLDFTHSDLAPRISQVVDFTGSEDPPICTTYFANPFDSKQPPIGDADLARMFGGPELTDWNGHGSWIGGNIAAALDHEGVNGIAPKVKLVSLKISQWCGSAYDSTIIDAFTWAGTHNIDVVSISFGGYLDLGDPDQALIWGEYNRVVQRIRDQGTIVAAAAGNEHVQVGDAGQVLSHGPAATPGGTFSDIFGYFEVPGGIPGVIDVSSTGNVVVPSSDQCAAGTTGSTTDFNATCKPKSDPHQAAGQGAENQLAYYSDYGARIDIAGPGGARKFNLPNFDRGGTPGFPYTMADITTAFEDFSTTSNWALEIPCFTFSPAAGFPADQCYSTIQGTSMATPHVSAVLALIASNQPTARGNPDRLARILKNSARKITGNQTRALDANDKSPGDLTGVACATGYCHLGGRLVTDLEAYGAGLVDAKKALNR